MSNFIEILHTNPNITTLQDFADEYFILLDTEFTIDNLFNYEGNSSSIKKSYTDSQEASKDRLEINTIIKIPTERVQQEIVATSGNVVFPNKEFTCFVADQISKITHDKNYKPLNYSSSYKGFRSEVVKINNSCTVWMWCRALGKDGQLLNITPFIDNVVCTNSENGGQFSFKVAPVTCEYSEEDGYTITKSSLMQYAYKGKPNWVFRDSALTKKVDRNNVLQTKRKKSFFHNIISTNDVIFIQYETLEVEKNQRAVDESGKEIYFDGLTVSNNTLNGRIFDFIGLVDTNQESYQGARADVSVDIRGRCLMKLLIEDGCYFFPLDQLSPTGNFVNSGSTNNGALRRLVNGELNFFNAYVDRSIEFSLQFVFNQLSNIKICDDKLFQFMDDKTYKYQILDAEIDLDKQKSMSVTRDSYENNSKFKKVLASGIWQIVRIVIDEEVSNRRIVDSSIATDSGSLLNFFKKVCQEPFVEFYSDTYGDRFYFIVRKPPYTKKSITKYIDNELVIDIDDSMISSMTMTFDDSDVYSWYRISTQGSTFGDSEYSLAEFPAIFFEDYAEIWGSRPYEVVTNYIDYRTIEKGQEKGKFNLDFLKRQTLEDLSFMIETNCYLPFTRKGTVQLGRGDRRIKRGCFVRLLSTGEICHVDSVSQTYNVMKNSNDRETTLQLSRCMVEDYIRNPDINYFNIVDFTMNESTNSDGNTFVESYNFKLNRKVFDFFLQRKQFKDE